MSEFEDSARRREDGVGLGPVYEHGGQRGRPGRREELRTEQGDEREDEDQLISSKAVASCTSGCRWKRERW